MREMSVSVCEKGTGTNAALGIALLHFHFFFLGKKKVTSNLNLLKYFALVKR